MYNMLVTNPAGLTVTLTYCRVTWNVHAVCMHAFAIDTDLHFNTFMSIATG